MTSCKSKVKVEQKVPRLAHSKLKRIRTLNTTLLNLENEQYRLLVRINQIEQQILKIWNDG